MTGKVLVTGGAGFIGSHVVDRLVGDGYSVRVLDNLSTGSLDNISRHLGSGVVDFVNGDIRDAGTVSECMDGVHAVVHLAALVSVPISIENPQLAFDLNVRGTENLLSESVKASVSKFVFISSAAVYGVPEFLPLTEQARVCPISPYGQSKLLGERYCLGFFERGLLEPVILRFFNVYGVRQGLNEYSGVITRFIGRCREHLPLIVYGDGSQTRDFFNVSDAAGVVAAAVVAEKVGGEVFNVGSGKATSINELTKTILELCGANLEIQHEAARTGDIKDSYTDISKAKQLLGYKPKVSLSVGLRSLLDK